MVSIGSLKKGDEIRAWMKSGFALKKGRRPDGSAYRYCPAKATNAVGDDFVYFAGVVLDNDPTNKILTLQVSLFDRYMVARRETTQAQVPYLGFDKMLLISPISFAGKPENPLRPTIHGIGTENHPYHTSQRVELVWR